MLKKLRIKFIIINMSIVTIMLGLIFGMLYVSTAYELEQQSLQFMTAAVISPAQNHMPFSPKNEIPFPYISILLDSDGSIASTEAQMLDDSDRDYLLELIHSADARKSENGVLKQYNLRFLKMESPIGLCYIFADNSSEQIILGSMVQGIIGIGLTAFLVFLGLSVLLARLTVRPVEKAWNQQKQFIADASHELKTPLTVIMTDSELLSAPDCTDAERKELSGSITSMSVQMRGLIESMLELARIDSGAVNKTVCRLNYSDTLSESAMLFEPLFFENGMSFSYDIAPDIMLEGNAAELKQLTEIFLDNASKYASPGAEVILTLKKLSAKKCVMCVSNTGEPISEEELNNLFKRFYRADKARTGCGSYGLGLSIAESIVGKHHGKIHAESKNGFNSFIAELPVSQS